MHFRRMVPKVPTGTGRPFNAQPTDAVATDQMRYRWRHDGHHGATYYKPMTTPSSAKSKHVMDESKMGLVGPKAPLYEGGRAAMLKAMMPERYGLKGVGPRQSLLGDASFQRKSKKKKKKAKKNDDDDLDDGLSFLLQGQGQGGDGDGGGGGPSSNWRSAIRKASIVASLTRRVSTITLGAQSLARADGWENGNKGQAPALDVLQTQPAENAGQALRKLRKGYDIDGSEKAGAGIAVRHKGKGLGGGFFKPAPKKDPLAAHKIFAKRVRERLQKSGIRCKDKSFNLTDLEQFKKRKAVIAKAMEHFHVHEPCSHEGLLEAMNALGHPLTMEELQEALTACTPPRRKITKEMEAEGYEWKILKEKVRDDGLNEMDFLKIVCHFEPPCGVKLLQARLTSSSWLKPRVSGVDATKYITDSGISFSGFTLGEEASEDEENGGGAGGTVGGGGVLAAKLGAGGDGNHGNDSKPGSPTTQEEEYKRTLAVAAASAATASNT